MTTWAIFPQTHSITVFYAKSPVDSRWTPESFHLRFKVFHVLASSDFFSLIFQNSLSGTSCSKQIIWYFFKYTAHIPTSATLLMRFPLPRMSPLCHLSITLLLLPLGSIFSWYGAMSWRYFLSRRERKSLRKIICLFEEKS